MGTQRAGSSAAELCALVTSLGYTYAAVSGYDDPRQWEMIATHPARV